MAAIAYGQSLPSVMFPAAMVHDKELEAAPTPSLCTEVEIVRI